MTVYQIIISYETDLDKSHLGSVTRTLNEANEWLEKQVTDFKDAFWKIPFEETRHDNNVIILNEKGKEDGCYLYGTIKEIEI